MFRKRETNINLTEPDIFRQIYERTHVQIFRYIYGLRGGPREDVEDLTAETFTRAWNARQRFDGNEGAALGWLYRIARNLVIDASRKEKSRGIPGPLEGQDIYSRELSPERAALQRDSADLIWNGLQAVSEQQREILVLRYMLEWRVKDIAAHLEMNENTVSVNIRRGLARLQKLWPHQEKDES